MTWKKEGPGIYKVTGSGKSKEEVDEMMKRFEQRLEEARRKFNDKAS